MFNTYLQARLLIALFGVIIAGVVGALVTGDPLKLVVSAAGFIGIVAYVLWQGRYEREPRWERLYRQGVYFGESGQWSDALANFAKALKKSRGNPQRQRASAQIANFLMNNGHAGDAEPYLREALVFTGRVYGPTAPQTVALRDRLSDLYRQTNQPGLAAQLEQRALAQLTMSGSKDTVGVAEASVRYAEALQAQGDAAGAAAQMQAALKTIEQSGPESPRLVPALLSASRYATATGDLGQAEAFLKRALENNRGDTPPKLLDEARAGLVDVYVKTERYFDAVHVFEQRLKAGSGSTEPAQTARLRRELADLLDKTGLTDEAAKQRRLAQTLEGMAAGPRVREAQSQPS